MQLVTWIMLFEDVTAAWGGEPDIGDGRGLQSCGIMWDRCIDGWQSVAGRQLRCSNWLNASCTGEHLWSLSVGGIRERRSVKLISENSEPRLAPEVTARSRKSEYVSRMGAGRAGRAADMGPVAYRKTVF